MKAKKNAASDITALDAEEYMAIRLFAKARLNTIYIIIGFLNEYFGGYSRNNKVVTFFFVDEQKKARLFKKICDRYLLELKAENDVALHVEETGHSCLESVTICKKLKEHYTKREADFLIHKRYRLSPKDALFKRPEELYTGKEIPLWNFNQLSYLVGVFIRCRYEGKRFISFANASHKLQLVISFLNRFCTSGDVIRVDYHFNMPYVTHVRYNERGPFMKQFLKYIRQYISGLTATGS